MTTITTRSGKGAPLTNAELDANFTALNAGKLETTATTTDIAEGTNQYFTNARARSAISATGSLSYDSASGVMSFTQGNTDTVAEGASNLYFTNARARSALSASGSLSYNATTGVISYTQPTNISAFTNDSGYLSGTVAVNKGGTGLTSLTAGYIPYGNGTSAFGSNSGFKFNATSGCLGVGSMTVPDTTWGTFKGVYANATLLRGSPSATGVSAVSSNLDLADNYLYAGYGTKYVLQAGVHSWLNAPSGNQYDGATLTERMRLDLNGNLGVGVTPSAWSTSATKAIDVGSYGSFVNWNTTASGIGNNLYLNAGGSWIYKNNGYATLYAQDAGVNKWFTTASGTAGGSASLTQAMTLDASGNLGLGSTTTSGGRLVISQSNGVQPAIYLPTDESTIQGANTNTQIRMGNNITLKGAGVTSIEAASGTGYIVAAVGGTERMRIDSSGNVGIGTSSPSYPLDVRSAANPTINVKATSDSGQAAIYIDGYASGGVYRASRIDFRQGGSNTRSIISDYTQNGTADLSFCNAAGTRQMVLSVAGGLSIGTTADPGAGAIYATGNITAYYSSDRTLKENIKDVDGALDKVCAIGSKTFDWTDEYIAAHGGEDGYFVQKSDFGVVAQDVQAVFPQAVRTREDGTLAVDYEKLSTLAFGAIKELLKRVEALEAK